MQHLDEGTIHAWLDNALASDEAASVAKHVDECRDCAALVAEARGMIVAAGNIVAALDNVRRGVIPAPTPARNRARAVGQGSLWRRLHLTPARAALAATLLIAIGSVLTVRSGGVERSIRPANVISDAAAPAPAPAAVTPSAQAAAGVMKNAAPTAPPPTATVAIPTTAEASRPARREVLERASKPSSNLADARQATDSARPVAVDRVMSATAPAPPAGASAGAVASAAAIRGATAQAAKTSADSVAAAPEQRRPVMALQEVVATGATTTDARSKRFFAATEAVEECYQVRVDSASPVVASGILPRFALVRNAATMQNVVRSVTPEGHVDSIVPGGTWERLTPNVVRVRFATAREQQPFTLQLNNGSLTGRAGTGDQATNLPVTRIDCRR